MITSAIKVGYTRATATSRNLRLVMDLDKSAIWLEESERPDARPVEGHDRHRRRGPGRPTPRSEALEEGGKIVKGPPIAEAADSTRSRRCGFADVEAGKGGKPLRARHQVPPGADGARRRAAHGGPRVPLLLAGRPDRARVDPDPDRRVRRGRPDPDPARRPLTGKVTVKDGPVDLRSADGRRARVRSPGQRRSEPCAPAASLSSRSCSPSRSSAPS